jgi:hypothetical protein
MTDEFGGLAQSLVVTGLLGQVREQVPEMGMSVAEPPGLGRESRIACIIARVTSSASLSCGVMPTVGRHGASCGELFSRSSVFTNSAVARVSRSVSTVPPGLASDGGTPGHEPR